MRQGMILVQHCQSEHHVNDLTGGWTDTDLTARGREQAAALATRLAQELGQREVSLWCSDLKRAHQTALPIAAELGVETECARDLREFNTGSAAWKTEEWARKHLSPGPERGLGVDRQPFPEAETLRQFYERVGECVRDLIARSQGIPVLVSHGGTTRVTIAWWLGMSVEQYDLLSLETAPGSVSVLGENPRKQHVLARLNDISHLVAAGLEEAEPWL